MSAEGFIRDVLRHAEALRAAGVLKLEVDGCSVELAPHQPAADPKQGDDEEDGQEHPAFNPKVKLRQYHRGEKS